MIEPGNRTRFAVESVAKLRIPGQRIGEHLNRNSAIEARVTAFVHLAHDTGAKRGEHFVRPEASTDCEGQT